jgi:hypothetical protein
MQVAAARTCGASYIVIRNVRDYERSPIRAVDPQEALTALFWLDLFKLLSMHDSGDDSQRDASPPARKSGYLR